MIEFHAITLLDKEWIDRHVMCENSPSADYNFGNMFIWDAHYRQLVCSLGAAGPGHRRAARIRRMQGVAVPPARRDRGAPRPA